MRGQRHAALAILFPGRRPPGVAGSAAQQLSQFTRCGGRGFPANRYAELMTWSMRKLVAPASHR